MGSANPLNCAEEHGPGSGLEYGTMPKGAESNGVQQQYDPANPLIIQGDRSVLVEVDNPRYAEARDALAPFAELEKSPEHIHTYRLTALSLWNAAAAGHDRRRHDGRAAELQQVSRSIQPRLRYRRTSQPLWPRSAGTGERLGASLALLRNRLPTNRPHYASSATTPLCSKNWPGSRRCVLTLGSGSTGTASSSIRPFAVC